MVIKSDRREDSLINLSPKSKNIGQINSYLVRIGIIGLLGVFFRARAISEASS